MLIKQPPFPHNKIFIFRITKASYYRNVSYSSLGENVLKIGYNLPLGILADYKRRVKKVSLEGNIIFDKVLVLANPVNNCFKHKQCYFVQKMCSLSHSFYLTISSCLSSEPLGPAHRCLVVNGNIPLLRLSPWSRCYPGWTQRPLWTSKDGVFLTPSHASWWKHCSPVWWRPFSNLGTNR